MPCASQPRVGSRRAVRRRPNNGIKRTSGREPVKRRKRKLVPLLTRARRKSSRPNLPNTSERGSKSSKNGKPNGGFLTRCEKSASANKKSCEHKDNRSERSGNWKRNKSVSAVYVPAKNASKSA